MSLKKKQINLLNKNIFQIGLRRSRLHLASSMWKLSTLRYQRQKFDNWAHTNCLQFSKIKSVAVWAQRTFYLWWRSSKRKEKSSVCTIVPKMRILAAAIGVGKVFSTDGQFYVKLRVCLEEIYYLCTLVKLCFI